jgi:hypothetical protein
MARRVSKSEMWKRFLSSWFFFIDKFPSISKKYFTDRQDFTCFGECVKGFYLSPFRGSICEGKKGQINSLKQDPDMGRV